MSSSKDKLCFGELASQLLSSIRCCNARIDENQSLLKSNYIKDEHRKDIMDKIENIKYTREMLMQSLEQLKDEIFLETNFSYKSHMFDRE